MKQINNFWLNDYKQLFFDIFHKNNKLYLICPVYSKIPRDISKIRILYNNKSINLIKRISKIKYEPTEILIYNFTTNQEINDIIVKYENITKKFKLKHIKTKITNTLSITTLFKDDFRLINIFYNYYKKQGVNKFYMYYNGILNDEIKKMYHLPGIVLIEWNFKYWNNTGFKHHAQLGQIHHAIYRYGIENNEYMIFCDLDEYMHIPNDTLIKFINNNKSIDQIGFCNYWSNTLDNKIPSLFPDKFSIGEKYDFKKRSKCIYKLKSIRTINIHYDDSFNINNPQKINNFYLFHFFNWCNKKRKCDLKEIFTINDN
jgi:hypothetical protein